MEGSNQILCKVEARQVVSVSLALVLVVKLVIKDNPYLVLLKVNLINHSGNKILGSVNLGNLKLMLHLLQGSKVEWEAMSEVDSLDKTLSNRIKLEHLQLEVDLAINQDSIRILQPCLDKHQLVDSLINLNNPLFSVNRAKEEHPDSGKITKAKVYLEIRAPINHLVARP